MNTLTQDEDNRIPRGALTAIEEIIMVASVMAEVPWAGGMIDMFLNFLNGTQKDNNSLEMLWNRMQTAMHQFVEKNIFDHEFEQIKAQLRNIHNDLNLHQYDDPDQQFNTYYYGNILSDCGLLYNHLMAYNSDESDNGDCAAAIASYHLILMLDLGCLLTCIKLAEQTKQKEVIYWNLVKTFRERCKSYLTNYQLIFKGFIQYRQEFIGVPKEADNPIFGKWKCNTGLPALLPTPFSYGGSSYEAKQNAKIAVYHWFKDNFEPVFVSKIEGLVYAFLGWYNINNHSILSCKNTTFFLGFHGTNFAAEGTDQNGSYLECASEENLSNCFQWSFIGDGIPLRPLRYGDLIKIVQVSDSPHKYLSNQVDQDGRPKLTSGSTTWKTVNPFKDTPNVNGSFSLKKSVPFLLETKDESGQLVRLSSTTDLQNTHFCFKDATGTASPNEFFYSEKLSFDNFSLYTKDLFVLSNLKNGRFLALEIEQTNSSNKKGLSPRLSTTDHKLDSIGLSFVLPQDIGATDPINNGALLGLCSEKLGFSIAPDGNGYSPICNTKVLSTVQEHNENVTKFKGSFAFSLVSTEGPFTASSVFALRDYDGKFLTLNDNNELVRSPNQTDHSKWQIQCP